MKKFKILISVIFILQSVYVFGQVPVNFKDCKNESFFVNADTKPSWKVDSISVIDYFNNYFAGKEDLKGVNGRIMVGILIDKTGKTCCQNFINLTKSNPDPALFKTAVNKMPDWIPAKQGGEKITYLLNLILNIEDGKFVDKQ